MSTLDFMDATVDAEDRAVLGTWGELLDSLSVGPDGPDDVPEPAAVTAALDTVRTQGWLEIGYAADVSPALFAEAVKRLHRREIPLSLPLPEVWLAARALGTVPGGADLLDGLGKGAYLALAVADLFSPALASDTVTTGWVPFAGALPVLLPVLAGDGVRLLVVPTDVGESRRSGSPDPSAPVSVLRVPTAGLAVAGELTGDALRWLRAETLAVQAAALVGQAQAMLAATLDYLTVREQFGVPVGSFQALKHRCADLVTDLHVANLISGHVATRMGAGSDLGPLGLLAKAFCGRAALRVASEAIQLHGGMGFTWECTAHRGLKRCAHLAMTGLSVGDCEVALGDWAIDADALLWTGGLDEAA